MLLLSEQIEPQMLSLEGTLHSAFLGKLQHQRDIVLDIFLERRIRSSADISTEVIQHDRPGIVRILSSVLSAEKSAQSIAERDRIDRIFQKSDDILTIVQPLIFFADPCAPAVFQLTH